MTEKEWNKYLEEARKEKMNSVSQSYRIDNCIKRIPDEVKSVLCVGVGDGYELTKIPNSVGTNLNPDQTKEVKRKGLECHTMDMHNLEFPDNSFDLIYSRNSFEHCLAPYIVLSEFARVAKKYVLIIVPDIYEWGESLWHYSMLNKKQFELLGEKVGLELYYSWTEKFGERTTSHGYLFKKRGCP